MDIFLIVLAVLVPVLTLALSFYLIVYFQHPDDHNTAYLPKIVVILGLTIAQLTVLMIPFDVANQGQTFGCGVFSDLCGGLAGLEVVWLAIFVVIALWLVLIIPWTIFFYESFDYQTETSLRACWSASCLQIMFTTLGVGTFVVCYYFLRFAFLPVETIHITADLFQSCNGTCDNIDLGEDALLVRQPEDSSDFIKIPVSPLVFLPGCLGFLGWFLFSIYTGIGLVALPFDLFRSFVYRPKYMPKDQYMKLKKEVHKKTAALLEVGQKIRKDTVEEESGYSLSLSRFRRRREDRKLFNEFKQSVIELEENYSDLKTCHEDWKFYNPLVPWAKLLFGIISSIISLLWVLQIALYNLARVPYGPDGVPTLYFLNTLLAFASKQSGFALLGTVLIGVLAFYLLVATIKGNEKFGLRFLLVEIHPMKLGGTYMNSFLVNTGLILFCVAPLIQFVSSTLKEYVVQTDMDVIFTQQIAHLRVFQVFYENNVFEIIMLSVAFITAVLMLCFPNDPSVRQGQSLSKRLNALKAEAEQSEREERFSKQRPNSNAAGTTASQRLREINQESTTRPASMALEAS